ncbi:MAG: helix-turn-helix domain-containing protein [Steroidobacteraceae bacterium]
MVTPILFALLPDFVLLDVAEAAEAFRIAERLAPGTYELDYLGSTPTLVCGAGLAVAGLKPFPAAVADHSIIVVTGVIGQSLDFKKPALATLAAWLGTAMRNETVTLMCVCAGSVIAAYAGLLRGVECTTHHSHIDELSRVEPQALVHSNRIFVEDGRICSSAGVTAGLDLTLHLIGKRLGHRIAAAVARELVVYMRRSGGDEALSPWVMHRNHLHPAVHRVQDAIAKNPALDWSSSRLAAVACTSPRNLTRLFAEHAGCSPLDYVQRLRIALARELVTHSELDLEHVAQRAGFTSAHQMRRVWRRWESRSPTAHRNTALRAS